MTSRMVFLRGMLMGAADIVPGVSGGTVAFITGIYERLIFSISAFLPAFIALLKTRNFKQFLIHVDAVFLFTLLAGILTSVFLFASVISYALVQYPIAVWSFFLGLIFASALVIMRDVPKWNASSIVFLVFGVVLALSITRTEFISLDETATGAFFSGMIAISAMLLPGVSGSFLLLLIGTYSFILQSIKSFDALVLIAFGAGCGLGLLMSAKVIAYVLLRFKAQTLCFLLGLMLGSLEKVWPWKVALSYRLNSSGEQVPYKELSVLPETYATQLSLNAEYGLACLCFMLGLLVIVASVKVLGGPAQTKT